jgi:homogentisate phytyltransferase/homogentisate geranylgeranyltransferase
MLSLLVMHYFILGGFFPSYLCAWPSIEMFDFPDHFLPPFCSIQRNGEAQVCFSSQKTQGPTLYHSQKFFDWKSSYSRISRWSISTSINAPGQQLQSEPEAHDSASIWRTISSSLDAFYRFSRPHTVIGTVKSCCCVVSFRWTCSVQDLLMKLVCLCVVSSFSFHWSRCFFWFKQALSIVSVSLLAVQSLSDISPLFLTGLLEVVKLWSSLAFYKHKNVLFHSAAFLLWCRQW